MIDLVMCRNSGLTCTLCCWGTYRQTFLSINRFEKKKNIDLAIKAFATLMRQQENATVSSVRRENVRLVVAGGLPFLTCHSFFS